MNSSIRFQFLKLVDIPKPNVKIPKKGLKPKHYTITVFRRGKIITLGVTNPTETSDCRIFIRKIAHILQIYQNMPFVATITENIVLMNYSVKIPMLDHLGLH